jgi:hypothetical protein
VQPSPLSPRFQTQNLTGAVNIGSNIGNQYLGANLLNQRVGNQNLNQSNLNQPVMRGNLNTQHLNTQNLTQSPGNTSQGNISHHSIQNTPTGSARQAPFGVLGTTPTNMNDAYSKFQNKRNDSNDKITYKIISATIQNSKYSLK